MTSQVVPDHEFRGPFADGPTDDALRVEIPSIHRFRLAEVERLFVIVFVLVASVVRGCAHRITGRHTTWTSSMCEGVIDGFEHLGPTFVKLGQLIASSPSVFPVPLADAALRCLDEVPPFDGPTARRTVEEDLGQPISRVFATFEDTPLSAASVGQVHACTLLDGREAVLKIQRPDIRHRMTVDLRIMYRVARGLHRFTKVGRLANVVGVIEDLHGNTFRELNPVLEAYRQSRFRDALSAFGDNTWITAPEIYWGYCGARVICMERMYGVPLDEFDTIRGRDVDTELVLRRIVKGWVEACTVHGPFHGDVHAGNLWLLDDGRATFLDFGIMGELEPAWRELVKTLFRVSMFGDDFSALARAFKNVGAFPEEVAGDDEVGRRMEMVFGPMFDVGLSNVSLGNALNSVVDLMDSFSGGAGTPKELLLIIKQLLYFERYANELAPDWAILTDIYLVRNVFPGVVEARVAETNVLLPD